MARGKSLVTSWVKLNGHGENNTNCMAKSRIFKRNDQRLRTPVIYAGRVDYTESTVQQILCKLPEALETAKLCYFKLFIGSKLRE